ncbi:hypothetical protein JAAARDRAFT_30185 [Jaapia argillacea MUCL 33604]|uniref:Uncharacterized protein n=1 Tax=Jaapia argillacea MUCL 33604 TaxID=933084 RepID=A0A067Q800_9AGAM|nr:hypothetical protein JAAARDRAFT_30185 [Jaapia argillacea MUCL 33604]
MDRLCDEILQLVLFELDDPTNFTLLSKRYLTFSQDAYVRASYFLARHGRMQAIFWALGRGKLMSEKVVDILLSCGAYLSRYLVQVAIHHYFRTAAHFVKTSWVRSLPLPVMIHFMKVGTDLYGDVPTGKGDDDGSLFSLFLNESRFPQSMKSVQWEEIRDIIQKYKFMPFCNKDPIMATFPLALAVEPRLLPYAKENGFHMDSKYRDFVFRKMFERPNISSETRTDDIVQNVRELCRLDSKMFLSRTVAAEVCMECKANEGAYNALKQLDKSGDLLFELRDVVEELMKLFVNTRSITLAPTINVLRQLWADYPSKDPTVRLVMLLTVFLSDNCFAHTTPATLKTKLDALGLTPLSKDDIFEVLINPFVERFIPILEYAKVEVGLKQQAVKELIEEVAARCLEIGCKGKMLRKLIDGYPFIYDTISELVLQRYQIFVQDLPSAEDEKACAAYEAKLCRDFARAYEQLVVAANTENGDQNVAAEPTPNAERTDEVEVDDAMDVDGPHHIEAEAAESTLDREPELGRVGQETLTAMIQFDEQAPTRSGRRRYQLYNYADVSGRLHYPADPLQVGRWIATQFGRDSPVTAIFMTHAVINDNSAVLQWYFGTHDSASGSIKSHVPLTLKHFKMLQRLGRAPNWALYHEIEYGAEFYFSEDDYLPATTGTTSFGKPAQRVRVKLETSPSGLPSSSSAFSADPQTSSRGKKRPRRTASTSVKSYVVPDSDDEAIADDSADTALSHKMKLQAKKRKDETTLSRWVKHLSILLKEEQKKYKEKKKRVEKSAPEGSKVKVPKSEFLRSLSANLRDLRKLDREKRRSLYGSDVADDDFSEGDDDEYQARGSRGKRRKANHHNGDDD